MNTIRQTILLFCLFGTLSLHAQTADQFFFQGQQAYDLGQLAEAEIYFSRAVELSPGHLRAYFNRGLTLLEAGQFTAARRDFEFMVRAEPSDSESWLLLGDCLVALSEPDPALEVYGYSIDLYPTAAAYAARGKLHLSQHRTDQADHDFRAALNIEPNNPDALAGLGAVALVSNRAEAALDHFDQALRYLADDADIWYNRAQACVQLQQYRAAALDLKQALLLDDSSSDAYALLGLCELKKENIEAAILNARRARRMDKENGMAWYVLAEISRTEQDFEWALNHYDMALTAEPNNADFYYRRGEMAYNAGFLEAARLDWLRVSELEPDNALVAERLRDLQFALSEDTFQNDRARARFEESLSAAVPVTEETVHEELMSGSAEFQVNIFEQ